MRRTADCIRHCANSVGADVLRTKGPSGSTHPLKRRPQRADHNTDDKPAVYLAPPIHGEVVSSFMNIRVANIAECYERWKGLGAEFLTEPKVHESETRCYMRDPDGHLIEVGEAKK